MSRGADLPLRTVNLGSPDAEEAPALLSFWYGAGGEMIGPGLG